MNSDEILRKYAAELEHRGAEFGLTGPQFEALVALAEDTAEVEDVGEYGYGGEIFPHSIVTNWPDVVAVILKEVKK